jgi:hypothetical protein
VSGHSKTRKHKVAWLPPELHEALKASVAVGVTPEVMRRHYENLDRLAIAKKTARLRLAAGTA